MDRLVPIPREDLPALRNLYKVNWPKYLVVYKTINQFILWLETDPKIDNLFIWSLNGLWQSNGTVIIKNDLDIHCATLEENGESLMKALCLIDWSPGVLICDIMAYLQPRILEVIEKLRIPVMFDTGTGHKFLTLEREKAENLKDIQLDDVTIKRLTVEDASIASSLWRSMAHFRKGGSLMLLQRSAKYNMCLGAYSPNNDLIGWIFVASSGAIGTLHVIEEYRGRKIAQALIISLCQYIARSLKLDVHVFTTHENVPSQKLFSKLGFVENTELVYNILTKPLNN
ncbi:uncharacterized protein DMENIID0001_033400 [Sergentomyia squamirostris]